MIKLRIVEDHYDDEYEATLAKRILGITPEQLAKIKAYCDDVDVDDEDNIGFEYKGQFIVNIFMDASALFAYDLYDAISTYGENNIRDFCKRVLRRIR